MITPSASPAAEPILMSAPRSGILERHQLRRGRAPPLRPEAARVLERALGVVLLEIGAVDRVAQPLAPRLHGAHRDRARAARHLQRALRILEERAPPAARLQRPRA